MREIVRPALEAEAARDRARLEAVSARLGYPGEPAPPEPTHPPA